MLYEVITMLAGAQKNRVFIDAALLIETGMYQWVDKVWLVVADIQTRVKRVMSRDGLAAGEVERRIKSQISDTQMMPYADEIIDNSGSLSELKRRVDALLNRPK